MKNILIVIVSLLLLYSCANKKEILYLQDSEDYNKTAINYSSPFIQPNDILKITVGALEVEAAIPYNSPISSGQGANIEVMQLDGYIVTQSHTIDFPQLGVISTQDKTTLQLQEQIKMLLEEGGHLKNP